jgi:hypothetical protein
MRSIGLCLLVAATLRSQDVSATKDLLIQTDNLRAAMAAGDWKKADELSRTLSDAVRLARDRAFAQNANGQIDGILNALPQNIETVIVAQQPFTLRDANSNTQPDTLTGARSYVLMPLAAMEMGKIYKALDGSTIRFALLAGRKFTFQPDDGGKGSPLGMIAHQACAIYAFATPVPESSFTSTQETRILGKKVWLFEGKDYEQAADAEPRTDTYLITLLETDVMLVCNNRDFFSSVISGIGAPSDNSKLKNLPEWKQVDRSAPVWGFRHFIPDPNGTDPTHPSHGELLRNKDEGAIGVTMQVGLPLGKISARWLTASNVNPWEELTKSNEFQGGASSRKVSDQVWELSVSDGVEPGSFAILALMGALGFLVLL